MLHHFCVVIAYFYLMHVLNTNFNVEGVFKCFIAYGAFTAANFPYKVYLAGRFLVDRQGGLLRAGLYYTVCHKLVCVLANLAWQAWYSARLFSGEAHWGWELLGSALVYTVLLAGWLQEEWVVLSHLVAQTASNCPAGLRCCLFPVPRCAGHRAPTAPHSDCIHSALTNY